MGWLLGPKLQMILGTPLKIFQKALTMILFSFVFCVAPSLAAGLFPFLGQ